MVNELDLVGEGIVFKLFVNYCGVNIFIMVDLK